MATVVNTPASAESSNGAIFLIGIILLIAFASLFFFYGLPIMGSWFQSMNGPQVGIPRQIDVNVQSPQGK